MKKLIDTTYYVLYKKYYRDDPKNFAPFFVNSLFLGIFQFVWVLVITSTIELIIGKIIFNLLRSAEESMSIMAGLGILSYIIISIGKRKEEIIEIKLSKKRENLYFFLFLLTFAIGITTVIILRSALRSNGLIK
jgi:hypothetical protein